MKVSPRTFTIFWDAHAWVGVIASIVLFPLFFLGPFALFWMELGPWAQHLGEPPAVSETKLLEVAQREVDARLAERPTRLGVHLPQPGVPWMQVQSSGPGGEHVTWVDPSSGEHIEQHSDLGHFLFSMHFLDPVPGGRHVAGLAAAVLLFLIVTGLAIQLGRLIRELVRFRPRQRARVFWTDAHKVAGVLGLPFLIVLAWTGATLCLFSPWLLPAVVVASFSGDVTVVERAEGWRSPPGPSGEPARAPELSLALERARAALPHARHHGFVLYNPGDASATVDVRGGREDRLAYYTNVRTSREGDVQWIVDPDRAPAHARVRGSLYGLHFARWAGPAIKVIYALLSLLGAFCILTGNLIWLERRRARARGLGDVVLARSTAGVCAGLCFAVAALFWANRVLPDHWADRSSWEHGAFWIAWASAIAYAGLRPSAARASRQLASAAGVLLCAVPLIDALQSGQLPLDPRSSSYVFGIELGLVALGSLLVAAGHVVSRVHAITRGAG